MDYLLVLAMAAIAIVGWVSGALKPHRPKWILVGVWPAAAWLGFYFFWQLFSTEPSLYSGRAQVGWPTLIFMIGGVCALLARPRDDNHSGSTGAAA